MKYFKSSLNKGSITKKIISAFDKDFFQQKIFKISEIKNAELMVEKYKKSIISKSKLKEYDPAHGVYIYAQNFLSVIIEQLSSLNELSKLTDAFAEAEEVYMPSGPPMSPLTTSYFTYWGFFDLNIGIKQESLGSIALNLIKLLYRDNDLLSIFEKMFNSRMGFYINEGVEEKYVHFKELFTNKHIKALVPSGYLGEKNELVFMRVFPEPYPEFNIGYSVVATTPYVLIEIKGNRSYISKEQAWLDYFDRTLPIINMDDKNKAYEFFLRYGLDRHYWNEYIFQGYVNHSKARILLSGIPDIKSSLPHPSEGYPY